MSFDLSEFLTEGLINSVNNGLIPPELATVYAGNYLVKLLINQSQVAQVSDAITAYQAAQVASSTEVPASPEDPASSAEAPVASSAAETPAS